MQRQTQAIHAGVRKSDPGFGSVAPPIYTSSTFIFPNAEEGAKRFAGESDGMVYSRFTNPTVRALEERLAAIEGTEDGIAVASGMAAVTMPLLTLLKNGDHILGHNVLYGGSVDFINRCLPDFGIESDLIDFTEADLVEKSIKPNTKVLFFETPTNPMMEIIDVEKIVAIAKKHGITTILDATFAPRPMQDNAGMGVDIIVHSLTKYMGGHSDVIAGAILGGKKEIAAIRKNSMTVYGPTLSPFAAYLVMRGITTLDIRVKQINSNAEAVAEFLENHPNVDRVYYPSLASHPQHELAKKQMPGGYGSVISFEVKGGFEPAKKLTNSIELFSLAVSLGGVESLIQHPASMTHSKLSPAQQEKAGIKGGLIRIAVGIENVQDQIAALKKVLDEV